MKLEHLECMYMRNEAKKIIRNKLSNESMQSETAAIWIAFIQSSSAVPIIVIYLFFL